MVLYEDEARVRFIKDYNARPGEAKGWIIRKGTVVVVTGETEASRRNANGEIYHLHNLAFEHDRTIEIWLVANEYLESA